MKSLVEIQAQLNDTSTASTTRDAIVSYVRRNGYDIRHVDGHTIIIDCLNGLRIDGTSDVPIKHEEAALMTVHRSVPVRHRGAGRQKHVNFTVIRKSKKS